MVGIGGIWDSNHSVACEMPDQASRDALLAKIVSRLPNVEKL
jgi:hypothetical protein